MFDLLTLQLDRHADNLLIQESDDGDIQLIPIDHGLSLPTNAGFDFAKNRLGGAQNVLFQLSALDQPMDPQTLQILERIDSDAFVDELRQSRDRLAERHPEVQGTVDDESLELARRSTLFVKYAAPRLTMREIFLVYRGPDPRGFAPSPFMDVIAAPDHDVQAVIERVVNEALQARAN
jgi:hypothetical protein